MQGIKHRYFNRCYGTGSQCKEKKATLSKHIAQWCLMPPSKDKSCVEFKMFKRNEKCNANTFEHWASSCKRFVDEQVCHQSDLSWSMHQPVWSWTHWSEISSCKRTGRSKAINIINLIQSHQLCTKRGGKSNASFYCIRVAVVCLNVQGWKMLKILLQIMSSNWLAKLLARLTQLVSLLEFRVWPSAIRVQPSF